MGRPPAFPRSVASVKFVPGPNQPSWPSSWLHPRGLGRDHRGRLLHHTPAVLIILPRPTFMSLRGDGSADFEGDERDQCLRHRHIAAAALRFAATAIKDWFSELIAVVAIAIGVFGERFPQGSGVAGVAVAAIGESITGARRSPPMLCRLRLADQCANRTLSLFSSRSAPSLRQRYVLVSYLQSGLVDHHRWLTQRSCSTPSHRADHPGAAADHRDVHRYLWALKLRRGVAGGSPLPSLRRSPSSATSSSSRSSGGCCRAFAPTATRAARSTA